jgi:hypothetical protein
VSEEDSGASLFEGTVEEMQEKLNELIVQNMNRQTKLKMDYQKAMDPLNFLHARITALIQVTLDESGQMKLELLTHTILASMLDMALAQEAAEQEQQKEQQARSRLLEGIPGVDPSVPMQMPPGMFSRG